MPRLVLIFALIGNCGYSYGQSDTSINKEESDKRCNLHFQITYIYQYKPAFPSPYNGRNSLSGAAEKQNSLTSTLFFGARLWKGAELYINPEIAGGSGLSSAFGLAASTNGETYRVGDPAPTLYLARGYLKQTISLSKEYSKIEDAANQVSFKMPKKYLQFLLGKYSLADMFDNNVYSEGPRTQFMNWAILNIAAWDYASNVRGYDYAFTTITHLSDVTYKASLSLLPPVPNDAELNMDIRKEVAINLEFDKAYKMANKEGHIRLLAYYNYGHFGSYIQAIKMKESTGGIPDITTTRQNGKHKIGFGLNIDQQINKTTGFFVRLGWNDGKTETWCYTEADRTATAGISINGKKWKRPYDNIGLGWVVNALSKDHKDYLSAGGMGFQLGDGKLNYGFETAYELYYDLKPVSSPLWLSADYQYVFNPGYNKDRGPVNVFSFRLHLEL